MKELLLIIKIMIAEKKDVYLSILCGFLAGVTAVGLFAANGYLISRAALETPLYVLIMMVAVVKIGSFIRAGSRYAERYYSHRATFTMLSDLRVYFYERLEKLAPSRIHLLRSGDLLSRIVGDVESLQNLFLRVLYPPIMMLLVFFSTLLFVGYYSITMVLLLLLGLLLTGFILPVWFAYKQRNLSSRIHEERANFSTEATEWLYGFRELKIHQLLYDKEELLKKASARYINEQEQENIQANYNQTVNMTFSLIISWLVLVVGAYFVSSGSLDGVFLAMLVMVSLTVFEYSTPMAAFPVYYEESERAAKRLLATANDTKEPEVIENNSNTYWETAPSIEMKKVSFRYPNEYRQTIKEVDLYLPPGTKTAIVGPSGSGKSTLLQLLLKLASLESGEIFLSGERISRMEPEKIWERTSVVLQENHFFHGTIQDNLLLTTDSLSEEELIDLLKLVELPHFSLTDIVLEKGQNLSGGEKQRLAIARAILKKSNLWLLDEPTSSLDAWTEKRLYEVLDEHTKEATLVIVSHRLTGLENMDQIVVMDQGRVIEAGTYEELMQAKGYFYQLKQLEKNIVFSA